MTALASVSGMDRRTGRVLTGKDHVRQSITDILTTPVGSRVCNRSYGSQLPDLIDAPMNDAGIQALYAATATAIAAWYPQITLTQIAVTAGEAPGIVTVSLTGTETDVSSTFDTAFNLALDLSLPLTFSTALLN
jgi:uncharacterized protein